MLLDDQQDLGAPGGPQPPQPGSPSPSAPPGTAPPAPSVDISQVAPVQNGVPNSGQPAPSPAPMQVADASSQLAGSLPAQPATNYDETIRKLQDSLKPRGSGMPVPPSSTIGVPGSLDNAPEMPGAPPQFGPTGIGGEYPVDEEASGEGNPSLFGRAVMRLFGQDVDDPLPWTRTGTTLAGALGGTEVGMAVPGPPIVKGVAAAVGGLTGTVVGAMAPENTLDALEMAGFLEPGTRDRMGLPDDQLRTLLLGEAALDMWTMGGLSMARATGRGVTNILTGANATSKGLAEAASREGIALLPVQVGEGTFARGYVSIMGRLPLVAATVKAGSVRAMDQIGRMFEGVPQRLGPVASMDEVSGNILRDAHYTADGIARHFDREANTLLGQADRMGLVVRPVTTRTVTDQLMGQISGRSLRTGETPRGFGGRALETTPGNKDLRSFLSKNTRLLTDIDPATGMSGTQIADLPLRQMDVIVQNIEQKMAFWAAKGDAKTVSRYEMLRNAVQADMTTGMVPTGRNAAGRSTLGTTPASIDLMNRFRQMDEDLTTTVTQLFQSTTAQRLGAVTSVTGRAVQMADLGTRGMDKLGEVVLRGDNPNAVTELARLVQPNTMRQLANAVFNKALDTSFTETSRAGVRYFDIDTFSKQLGLGEPTSAKFAQTRELMNHAGGLTMDQLQTFVEFTRRAGAAEIPNVSQFLSRKMTLGGVDALMKSVPGATLATAFTGAGTAAGGITGGLVGALGFLGGTRLISSMIANPQSARALTAVMDTELSALARKAAWIRAVTYGTHNLVKDGYMSAVEADNLLYNSSLFANVLHQEIKRNAP